MASLSKNRVPGIPQEIIQRRNKRPPCFTDDKDVAAYADRLKEFQRKFPVAIHVYVCMTNRVYRLLTRRCSLSRRNACAPLAMITRVTHDEHPEI